MRGSQGSEFSGPARDEHRSRASRRTAAGGVLLAAVLTVAAFASFAPTAFAATPPAQPAAGPGGAGYQWSTYIVRSVTFSDHAKDYWTYEPSGWQGGGSAPATAPVIMFQHGWLGDNPSYYSDWIAHLARKGNVIIFPRFQTSAFTPPANFTPNAIFSIQNALSMLAAQATVKPDTSLGMTLIGHSWGGPVSVNIANRWQSAGLPQPKAVLLVEPYNKTIDSSLSGIPSTAKMDCVVGNVDTTTGRTGCDVIWDKTGQIPSANRNYVWMFSDAHGSPGLVADHRLPTTGTSGSALNALDWYGIWKLGDGLRDCVVLGTNCNYALGNTSQQTYMGLWSDGVAVTPLSVTTVKPACPAGSTAKGC